MADSGGMYVQALRTAALAAMVGAALSGCTLLVWSDADGGPQCETDADCGAALRCDDARCVAVADDAIPGAGVPIGPEGGTVEGPAGILLVVAPGSVNNTIRLQIERITATLPRTNFDADAFYRLQPTTVFDPPAQLTVPGEGSLFMRPADGAPEWAAIEPTDGTFEVGRVEVFARGEAVDLDESDVDESDADADANGDEGGAP